MPYQPDWTLPLPWPYPRANLTFVANPNSPSGTFVPLPQLERLVAELDGPLVLDEAYVDFADTTGLSLSQRANVVVSRSLSKSYALAGIRFGFAVAQPACIREFLKVKDSYNCDVLSLAAATAALEDQGYLHETRARILATRQRLEAGLSALGFVVVPSQANFVWCCRPGQPVKPIYEELKCRKVLIRYMNFPDYGDGLRISVGTDSEIQQLFEHLKTLV